MLNIPPSDARFYSFLNEATQRLLQRGRYWGTFGRYAVSVNSQLMSLPPQIDTIEKVAVARQVLPLHDKIYEFLDFGWSTRDETLPNGSGVWEVLERGNFPTMVDIPAPGNQLTIKCDVADDAGQQVLLLGYDTSTPPNWIRTQVGGVWQDGEIVQMTQNPGTTSINGFSRLTGVQPALTGVPLAGQWWIYAGTTLLSNYQYFENSPTYKRYLIPFVNETVTTVELIGKLAFIPVTKPTDYPVIQNMAALKLAARAIKAEEESSWVEANILWNGGTDKKTGQKIIGAIQELDFELDHQLGGGRHIGINISGGGIYNDAVAPLW